jgi:hypothetical protein
MPRHATLPPGARIADTIGVLSEKKAAGLQLIRSFQQYRRMEYVASPAMTQRKPMLTSRVSTGEHSEGISPSYQRKLRRLYLRKAALDGLIRSIEQYRRCDIRAGRVSKWLPSEVA